MNKVAPPTPQDWSRISTWKKWKIFLLVFAYTWQSWLAEIGVKIGMGGRL